MLSHVSTPEASRSFFENMHAHFNANVSAASCPSKHKRRPTDLFTPIRDIYDYLDEFGKIPVAFVYLASVIFTSENKLSDSYHAVLMFLEAIVSILTRPIVTLCKGYMPEKEYKSDTRFSFN